MESGSFLIKVREILRTLSPQEQKLAGYFVDHPDTVSHMKIGELASRSGVSISTIMRLCKKLGLSGYKELCRSLYAQNMMEEPEPILDNIRPGDDLNTILCATCTMQINAIRNTMKIMDREELEKAVSVLCRAQRIEFYGVGNSESVASTAALKFSLAGKNASCRVESVARTLSATTLKPGDAAVLISHSGETTAIVDLARIIRENGTPVISITCYGKNTLSELSDIHLHTVVSESHSQIGVMSSSIAQLTVVNTLYAAVCSRSYDQMKRHLERDREVLKGTHLPGNNR